MFNKEYNCKECEHVFEYLHMTRQSPEIVKCPRCNSSNVYSPFPCPNLKTTERIEDIWRKERLIDPQEPEYKELYKEKAKARRKANRKRREEEIEKGLRKKGPDVE